MKSEWKVTYNGSYYEVYRLRDVSHVDHSGNREYAPPTFKTKDLAQAYAAGANAQNEAQKATMKGMSKEERRAAAIENETIAKIGALMYFMKALDFGGKHFDFMLLDDETVEVTDMESGCKRKVNVACDNVPAMMLDILKQAGDWVM